jgi:EpsI family protein
VKFRLVLLVGLLAAAGFVRWRMVPVDVSVGGSLSQVPMRFGLWAGRQGGDFAPDVLRALGVDEYVNRSYAGPGGRAANLYVGYYRSQRQGASIHSPLNCLPGAGWEPESIERVSFGPGSAHLVRVRKGSQRLVVLYWYQTPYRVEGDEYRGRFYTVMDSLEHGRNDAALVRVTVALPAPGAEALASQYATELATLIQPEIQRVLFPDVLPVSKT